MANMILVGVFYNKEVSNEVEIKVFCLFVCFPKGLLSSFAFLPL